MLVIQWAHNSLKLQITNVELSEYLMRYLNIHLFRSFGNRKRFKLICSRLCCTAHLNISGLVKHG